MEFDFAQTEEAQCPPSVRLFTVYVVYADQTYDVRKNTQIPCRMVAVRTLDGEGVLETTAGIFTLSAHTLLIADIGSIRRYRPVNGKWNFWWFEYEGGDSLLEKGRVFSFPITEEECADYDACLGKLRHSWSRRHASALFLGCLFGWKEQIEASDQSHILNTFYESVEYMRTHLSNFSVQKLADFLQVSDRTLRSVFHTVIRLSPKSYFDRLRMQKAARMLKETRKTVSEISDVLGFSSPYHFSRAFSACYSVSPRGYRNLEAALKSDAPSPPAIR